ncbi:MAG: hypothetical protein SPE99_02235 [Blautia sp.]|nr:hypothetical protein [Blautia sp.]
MAVKGTEKRKVNARRKKKGQAKIPSLKSIGNYMNFIIGGVVVILIILLISIIVKSCGGVKNNSPQKVVESLVKYSVEGKEKAVKKCYGADKDISADLQAEITASIKYYKAHNPKKVAITGCDVLAEYDKYTYVYIIYNLVLENDQSYPCIGTYMVGKKEKDYYVMSSSEITAEMNQQAADDYAKFMTTDAYKNYAKDYDTFIKKNPGYEEKIAGKIG